MRGLPGSKSATRPHKQPGRSGGEMGLVNRVSGGAPINSVAISLRASGRASRGIFDSQQFFFRPDLPRRVRPADSFGPPASGHAALGQPHGEAGPRGGFQPAVPIQPELTISEHPRRRFCPPPPGRVCPARKVTAHIGFHQPLAPAPTRTPSLSPPRAKARITHVLKRFERSNGRREQRVQPPRARPLRDRASSSPGFGPRFRSLA